MKPFARSCLALLTLLPTGSALAAHVVVGIGLGYYPHYHYWHPPVYVAPPVYYYPPPTVVIPVTPPVYVQQPVANVQTAPGSPANWYYCSRPKGYYPYVPRCKVPWQAVPATPPQGVGAP